MEDITMQSILQRECVWSILYSIEIHITSVGILSRMWNLQQFFTICYVIEKGHFWTSFQEMVTNYKI